jgi:mono/diheme cytochrome c family protein
MERLALLIATILLTSVAGAAEVVPVAPQATSGQHLFEATCQYCHGANGFATRDLARRGVVQPRIDQRQDLDPKLIRFVVRHGVGNMPALTPTDLSDRQIDAVIAYLTRPR